VDQPVTRRVPAKAGEHGFDSPGRLAEDAPHRRLDGLLGQLGGMPGPGPGQMPDVQGRAGEPRRRAESSGVAVQRADHPAEVRDQPPGRPVSAEPALDPAECDAAPAWKLRGSHAGAEPGDRDGQAGVAGGGGQPGQLGVELAVAAAAWQAHPDDQALAGSGVAAEQLIGVLAHPAQPPDRYALLVQRGPGQIPQLAGERAHAAFHVLSIGPLGVPQRASAPPATSTPETRQLRAGYFAPGDMDPNGESAVCSA